MTKRTRKHLNRFVKEVFADAILGATKEVRNRARRTLAAFVLMANAKA